MAEPALIDGNLINDARPLAVEQQGAMPLPVGAATLADSIFEIWGIVPSGDTIRPTRRLTAGQSLGRRQKAWRS